MSKLQEKIIDCITSQKLKFVKDNLERIDIYFKNSIGVTSLHESTRIQDDELFQKIANHYTNNIDVTDFNGSTALKYACCEEGNLSKVKYLIKKGASINKADKNGFTPLFCSIGYGLSEITEYLLEKGANASVQSKKEKLTPIHLIRSIDILKVLLKKNVKLDLKDINGKTFINHLEEDGDDYIDVIQFYTKLKKMN